MRKVSQKLALPSRDATSGRSQIQLNASKLTPSPEIYIATLTELENVIAEILEQDATKAPSSDQAKAQQKLAAIYRDRAKQLEAILIRLGDTQMELRGDIRERLDQLVIRTEGADWFEDLMRVYVVFGILQDGAVKVSKGLPPAKRIKTDQLLSSAELEKFCQEQLAESIASDSVLAPRLALFGRMVVADALLEIRDSVDFSKILPNPSSTESVALAREQFKVLEPFTSELIAQHTLRMDSLGLTA